jgi:hypothetical protein
MKKISLFLFIIFALLLTGCKNNTAKKSSDNIITNINNDNIETVEEKTGDIPASAENTEEALYSRYENPFERWQNVKSENNSETISEKEIITLLEKQDFFNSVILTH